MDALLRDLRYAVRQLRLSPSYAALAIVSIGIGIGATTTIFSLVEALLLRPVPAARAGRLIYGYETSPDGSGFHSFSFLQYKDLRDRSRTLTDLAAFDITPLSVATSGDAQMGVGFNVSGNFFKTFGATPELGRFFLPEEDSYPDVGSHPVAVVSHAFWERRLAGDTSAVGRAIRVNGRAFTVVGEHGDLIAHFDESHIDQCSDIVRTDQHKFGSLGFDIAQHPSKMDRRIQT